MDVSLPYIAFGVGSQHLYGPEALERVAEHAQRIASELNHTGRLSLPIRVLPVLTRSREISEALDQANVDPNCVGLIFWMHTFSPAKLWVNGLKALRKPFLHLHTQLNRELPWASLDMDYMNLHQSAHGDREFGYICTRLGLQRKVLAGAWDHPCIIEQLDGWMRAALGWHTWQGATYCRLGDNMRSVAVTEGDKVAAEAQLGFAVHGFGMGELAEHRSAVTDRTIADLCDTYAQLYELAPELEAGGARHAALRDEARTELALRSFLDAHGASGFTDTFEDLHGLERLPGLAVQRLMAEGYGFGAEGDWKTAALLHAVKVMGQGCEGGTSFMEDYTYHFGASQSQVLGAHMLEVCPSIAAERPRLEIHPLGIGGREDPVRLVFTARTGPALNASMIDMGERFRLILNEVDAVELPEALPKLPVARALWECRPDFVTAATAWIQAGGAHHTVFTYSVNAQVLRDFARIAGLEVITIDAETRYRDVS